MTTEEALIRVRAAIDKAERSGKSNVWEVLAGENGENYEDFVFALLGYGGTLEGEVQNFEQVVEALLAGEYE